VILLKYRGNIFTRNLALWFYSKLTVLLLIFADNMQFLYIVS